MPREFFPGWVDAYSRAARERISLEDDVKAQRVPQRQRAGMQLRQMAQAQWSLGNRNATESSRTVAKLKRVLGDPLKDFE